MTPELPRGQVGRPEGLAEIRHLGIVSHELRTPLQAAIGYADLLEGDLADRLAPQDRANLSKLQASLARLTRLVDDLLAFGQLEVGGLVLEAREIDVRAVVEDVIASSAPMASAKGIDLATDVPARLPTVVADELRLYQALANLVRNAVKFTPEGGTIQVAVFEEAGRLRFLVKDSGIGIAARDQARVFEPFERAGPDRQEGVGLGLAIAKRIVDAHGGAIGLESRPGAGSTFWFTLPLASAPRPGQPLPFRTRSSAARPRCGPC
jgi:signal transduction histidine kinase